MSRTVCTEPQCLYKGYLYLLFNPLNAELNPICHLLALLRANQILHVSMIRVKHDTMQRRGLRIGGPQFFNLSIRWMRVYVTLAFIGRHGSVPTATPYGLEVRESKPDRCRILSICLYLLCGPPSLLYNGYRVSFPGIKRPVQRLNKDQPCAFMVCYSVNFLYPPTWPFAF
jgi:hypothetical protein